MFSERDAEKLLRKIQKACEKHELPACFLAVGTAMETILEQLDDAFRYQFLIRLIEMNLWSEAFVQIKQDISEHNFASIAQISDNEMVTVAILGKIKGLVDLCVRHWEVNRKIADPASLRRHYKIDYRRNAEPLGKLGARFNDNDLKGMLAIFENFTEDMLRSIPDDDQRRRFALAAAQVLFPPEPLENYELDLTLPLQMARETQNPEVLNITTVAVIRRVLGHANSNQD